MAKKVVATLQKGKEKKVKVVVPYKDARTGRYRFRETVVWRHEVKDILAKAK